MLDLHPAVDVVPTEVQLNDVQVSDDHRGLRGGLFVVVEPLAAKAFRLVPDLQEVLVVLDDDLERGGMVSDLGGSDL